MNRERWKFLMDNENERLSDQELNFGWHFCAEWDGLLVGPGGMEALVCSCGHPAIEAWKDGDEAKEMMRILEERQ